MRILLTGATSFTGKHLLALLRQEGSQVFCLVRNPAQADNEILWDFSSALPPQTPVCDVVIHLAAYVDFGLEWKPEQYQINTLSTIHLASYAQKHDAFMILSSMVGVHGAASYIDSRTPVNPQSHYALSKFLAEEVMRGFLKRYAILRIGGIYGLDGPKHLGLNNAITDAFYKHISPTLKGPGEARRNYICVLDATRWISHVMRQFTDKKSPQQNILYLAGSETLTIAQYLHSIAAELLDGQKVVHLEGQNGADSVVHPSPCPFPQMSFVEYLRFIKKERAGTQGTLRTVP